MWLEDAGRGSLGQAPCQSFHNASSLHRQRQNFWNSSDVTQHLSLLVPSLHSVALLLNGYVRSSLTSGHNPLSPWLLFPQKSIHLTPSPPSILTFSTRHTSSTSNLIQKHFLPIFLHLDLIYSPQNKVHLLTYNVIYIFIMFIDMFIMFTITY